MKQKIIALSILIALIIPTAALAAPDLSVDVSKDDTTPGEPFTVSVTGTTTPHAKVSVNGHRIWANSDGEFTFTESVTGDVYEYDYNVKSTYNGETTTLTKSVYVEVDPPEIRLEQPAPITIGFRGYYIWFDWNDPSDANPKLYINGKKTSYVRGGRLLEGGFTGAFSPTLLEGYNTFELKLVNRYGEESGSVTKVVYYQP